MADFEGHESQGVSRRRFLTRTAAAVTAGSLLGAPAVIEAKKKKKKKKKGAEEPPPPKPNVVLIIADQLRADALGCYGNLDAWTPNIDRLSDTGVRFDNAYVTQPVCSPSRSSIFTGLYPHATGVIDNNITLEDHSTSFPRLLHEAGYRTGYFGKWHLGPKGADRSEGGSEVTPPPEYFDIWQGYHTGAAFWPTLADQGKGGGRDIEVNSRKGIVNLEDAPELPYLPDEVTDGAVDFIKANGQQPFCLTVSYYPPHPPWTAPWENIKRFRDRDVRYPMYHAMMNRVDENVGRIIEAVESAGVGGNTVFVVTADHGHMFEPKWNSLPEKTHYKRLCYDSSARAPLIFNWPWKLVMGVRKELLSLADIAPTVLELCGLPVPEGIHGSSAVGLLKNKPVAWRDTVIVQNQPYKLKENPTMYERCAVTNTWKMIVNSERPPELYYRLGDPNENKNYFGQVSVGHIEEALFQRIESWAQETGDEKALADAIMQWRRPVPEVSEPA